EAEMLDHHKPLKHVPPVGPTVEYGQYLGMACRGCHGAGLSGGPVPGTPPTFKPARNITMAALEDWSEADFFRAVREGKRPDGAALDPFMPSRFLKFM